MGNDTLFIEKAISLSIENIKKGGGPFGAIIVKNDIIIGEGVNQVTINCDPTAHAEIIAIRNACSNLKTFDLSNCIIYSSCEPCPMCLSAIYWARISKIFFSNTKHDAEKIGFKDNFIYEEISKPLALRKTPINQIFSKNAHRAFSLWKENIDKIEY